MMSHTWGPVTNHFRLGIEVTQTPATVSSGTSSVSLRVVVYGQSVGWGHNWTNTLTLSGAFSGSQRVSFYSGTGETVTKTLYTTTVSVPTVFASGVARSFSASIDGYGAASVTHSHTVGARPHLKPRPPLNPRAVWVSDGRVRVQWQANYDGANGAQPWSGVRVLRRNGTGAWQQIASLGWAATSFEDSAAPLNAKCEYAVVSHNSAGESGRVSAGFVAQRPDAPRNVSASKTGRDIHVTWTSSSPPELVSEFRIYDGSVKVGTVSGSTLTFTHANASTSQTHTYTVSAVAGSLESARSQPSNTVQLLARPNAPTTTAPAGDYVAPGDVALRWLHNPSDASRQTRAEVRYRTRGGNWTTRTVNGASSSLTAAFSKGVYEWQVRTWGEYQSAHENGASEWSNIDTFSVVTRPTVRINSPGSSVHSSRLHVEWGFYQEENARQAGATILLVKDDRVVHTEEVAGDATDVVLGYTLENGTSYTVTVSARSGHGLVSELSAVTFNVAFPEPPTPVVFVEWDGMSGATIVNVSNPIPSGVQPAAVSNDIYRSVDGGNGWTLVRSNAPVDTVFHDYECPVSGEMIYRVVAISALPSTSESSATVRPSSPGVFISGGAGFANVVRLTRKTAVTISDGLEYQEAHYFAGRDLPVFFEGTARRTTAHVSALLLPSRSASASDISAQAALQSLRAFAGTPGMKLLRDSQSGLVIYGRISGLNTATNVDGVTQVQLSFIEGGAP